MSVHKEGGVLVRERKPGRVYALRFRAYGERQYLTLGYEHEDWNHERANVELQNVLARQVGRGWLAVSGRGPGCEWELTELGWAKVRRGEKRTGSGPPDRATETGPVVAA